jgi:hypothetical protein
LIWKEETVFCLTMCTGIHWIISVECKDLYTSLSTKLEKKCRYCFTLKLYLKILNINICVFISKIPMKYGDFLCKSSCTIYYINFTFSFALIRCLENELVFHCRSLNAIFIVMTLILWCFYFTRKSPYFMGIFEINTHMFIFKIFK